MLIFKQNTNWWWCSTQSWRA